ncbi:uncharacterized protein LOC127851453 isoform X1 [Dreissena polymorpha]|uniref:uncharacterized protein LOC127851453 isoform X1 n=1 Tax=Dreissena polymorpha TaxID=45954 RepID=UPI00226536DA|nr:uncharacterized protein LOC127851453 isoform X1 [Dreissena polymorpha]
MFIYTDMKTAPPKTAAFANAGSGTNIGAVVGGTLGALVALLLLVLLIICLVRRRRRDDPEKSVKPGQRSIRYFSQSDDVTVTENELYEYDGQTPGHTTNALFIGGIPETPASPGYIPHFFTDSGDRYAVIVDSTRAKSKSKERPSLSTVPQSTSSKGSSDSNTHLNEMSNDRSSAFESDRLSLSTPNEYTSDKDPGMGVGNPGYDPAYFTAISGEENSGKSSSPYDYIDHDKLQRDEAGFDIPAHPREANNVASPDVGHEDHYKRVITPTIDTDDDGYLKSPKRISVP